MSTGNFVELVSAINGLSPGYGKMMLLYSTKKNVAVSDLTAAAINAEIAAGTIIGIVQGWNMVAAASIAEKNLARANGSFRKIDGEILGDTMTFEDNTVNQYVLSTLSGNTFNAVFLDDQGRAYGEQSLKPSSIGTMDVNFYNKASNGFSFDQTNEKTIAITAIYLLEQKKLGFIDAGTEVEDIVPKTPLIGKISSITTHTATSIVVVMDLINEKTGALLLAFDFDPILINVSVNGITVTAAAAFAANQLTLTLTKTVADFNTATDKIKLRLSTAEYYLTDISFNIADFLV